MADLHVLSQQTHGCRHDVLRVRGIGHSTANRIQHRQPLSHKHRSRGFGNRVENPHHIAVLIADRAIAKREIGQLWQVAALDHQRKVFDISGFTCKRCLGDFTDLAPGLFPDLTERTPQCVWLIPENRQEGIVIQRD